MCTEGKDNLHILVRHTELIYFVDEYGHKVKTVGHGVRSLQINVMVSPGWMISLIGFMPMGDRWL